MGYRINHKLPLMYAAEKTSNSKYINAAKNLMKWMENVHLPNGAWMNDVNVSDWIGTTVFSSIALYEALHHYGYLLDDSTKNIWQCRLFSAGEFIFNNDFIYSRRNEGRQNMNINYSASATYALYVIGKEFNRDDFVTKAKQIASDLKYFFTENDYFLFGEGPEIREKTKNGCFPVDLGYNVEESLPNMMFYAQMANDSILKDLLLKSMDTHLEFMLPDGAWDNSWGTRSYKWTYWGGRTSDGMMAGFAIPDSDKNPEYYEAVRRNLSLLKQATHNGLLHGGMHYKYFGVEPCIHHTFGHAKALASFLAMPVASPSRSLLPSEKNYGVKYFKDIHTWLATENDWRATVTGFDAEYTVKGIHPMGGTLSLLWNKKTGPLFAATMNQYSMIEAPNMQSYTQSQQMSGTPRIELLENGVMYSNLDDLDSKITYHKNGSKHLFKISTHLVDILQTHSSLGKQAVEIDYILDANNIVIQCCIPESFTGKGVRLTLPVISNPDEKMEWHSHGISIKKHSGDLIMESNNVMNIETTEKNGRIFNPVPGFCFIPITIKPDSNGKIEVKIRVE